MKKIKYFMLPVLLLIVSQIICGQTSGGEIKREKIVTHKKKHNKKIMAVTIKTCIQNQVHT